MTPAHIGQESETSSLDVIRHLRDDVEAGDREQETKYRENDLVVREASEN